MTTKTIAACVDNGATLLDEKRPGWFREIAMDRLAMSNCTDCVLGQVYGSYWSGCNALGLMPFRDSYGFFTKTEKYEYWNLLADLWRAEIRTRLEQA